MKYYTPGAGEPFAAPGQLRRLSTSARDLPTPHGFEDRVSDVRALPATSIADQDRPSKIRARSLAFSDMRDVGCHLGCQDLAITIRVLALRS